MSMSSILHVRPRKSPSRNSTFPCPLSFRIGQYCSIVEVLQHKRSCHLHLYWTRSTCLTCFYPSLHTFFFKRPAGHSRFSFLSIFHHWTFSTLVSNQNSACTAISKTSACPWWHFGSLLQHSWNNNGLKNIIM